MVVSMVVVTVEKKADAKVAMTVVLKAETMAVMMGDAKADL